MAEPAAGSFVALHDGEPTEAEFIVGAAGVYPPVMMRSTGIALPEPARTMSGEHLPTVEVLARAVGNDVAFWGDVEVDANAIDLTPSQPAAVRVTSPDAAPIAGATVRLARATLGLVVLEALTDQSGVATFPSLPEGEFVATARIAGGQAVSVRVVPGRDATLVLERGREVHGVVRDDRGDPVAGATVAIHGGALDADPLADVPVDIVETNLTGGYRASGVPGARFVAIAIATDFAPSHASTDAPPAGAARLDIVLQRGFGLDAVVVDENDRPVRNAKVEWRDTRTAAGATSLTNEAGRARFRGVPRSGEVFANFADFVSGRVALDSAELTATGFAVKLRVSKNDARLWRYRLSRPDNVTLTLLEVRDEAGVRCRVDTVDERDFTLTGCGEGDTSFIAHTNFGSARWSAGPFVDGAEVDIPAPVPVVIEVRGHEAEPWAETSFQLLGAGAISAPLEVRHMDDRQRLEAALYPGSWRLVVVNPRVGTIPFTIRVAEEPVETELELVALTTFRVEVVDAYGAPVTGAYSMLFRDGTLVDVARSAGQLPIEFRVRPPFNGELLVVDPRRGEGRATLETAGETSARVALREPVLSLPVPNRRPSRDDFAARSGATLVARDRGWVLDFDEETAGTRAGLQRGDQLVSAWPDQGGMRVVVHRQGAGFIDVVVR